MHKKPYTQQKIKNKALAPSEIASFRRSVWRFYRAHKRAYPWRDITNPYHILVSEIMLQQTQTERVIPKYLAFIKRFPTVKRLAAAPLRDVLVLWSGLGYNRRAKHLWYAAQEIVTIHKGRVPGETADLLTLPGIGNYTANAITAFAYDKRSICIETNIRTVFTHHFFKEHKKVSDDAILHLIDLTLPKKNFRDWYYALMDLGASLKRSQKGINAKNVRYVKQTPFRGSRREVRGAVLKALTVNLSITRSQICTLTMRDSSSVTGVLNELLTEGLIIRKGRRFTLP